MRYQFVTTASVFALLFFFAPLSASALVRPLYVGLSGDDVSEMQTLLISKGYLSSGKNTGYFGGVTLAALKKFQCDNKIACTSNPGYGIYGTRTSVALLGGDYLGNKFEFSGWVPYWKAASGTQDVIPHLSQLTSVMPFGYTMKNNGTLNDAAHITDEPWTSFIAEARRNKVKIVPSVMWGDGATIHKILSNARTRVALEDEIAKVVKENNFDGIDIDFEAKQYETVGYFSTFLKGLDVRMGNKLIYCTVEARMPLYDRYSPGSKIPADAQDYANDYKQMNKYCDRVEIMAYDQGVIDVRLNKLRAAPYAPVADTEWVEGLISMATKDISKNKIIIGVATYGYEYDVRPVPGDGFSYKVLCPFNPRYATEMATKLGIIPTRNGAGEIGFSYDTAKLAATAPTNGEVSQIQNADAQGIVVENTGSQLGEGQSFNYLSWSDAQAVADKVALAKKFGLRGVAVFKFDGGEDQGVWGVLK